MIKQLFMNERNQLSASKTIQMLSAITLCIGFILSIVLDKPATSELGFAIAALAGWTGTSKGYVDYKKKTVGKDE